MNLYTVFKEQIGKNREYKSSQDKMRSYLSLLVWSSLYT